MKTFNKLNRLSDAHPGKTVLVILAAFALAHIADYHFALDSREHGAIAQHMAFNSICKELDAYWIQGEEAKRRAPQTNKEPQ